MDIFVARQPIFNPKQEIMAYEILYRSSLEAKTAMIKDESQSSLDVIINSFYTIGMPTLTWGKPAFINFSNDLLENEVIDQLSPKEIVIEVLERVDITPALLASCERLKSRGFKIALDDVISFDAVQPLLEYADYIKVDVQEIGYVEQKYLLSRFSGDSPIFLAEKIETQEQFDEAKSLGYSLFQGFFFQKPAIIQGKDITVNQLLQTGLWQAMSAESLDYKELEQLIKLDLGLTYRLLRLVNSAFWGFRKEVVSIHQALVILGENEVRKWLSFLLLRMSFSHKCDELMSNALIRGIYCESLSQRLVGVSSSEGFLLGLFSLIDAILDQPLSQILERMPLSNRVKSALVGEDESLGILLASIQCLEQGDWPGFFVINAELHCAGEVLQQAYIDALTKAQLVHEGVF